MNLCLQTQEGKKSLFIYRLNENPPWASIVPADFCDVFQTGERFWPLACCGHIFFCVL